MKRLVFLGILFVGCTDTLNDAQHDVPSAPSTVILPGMPGLEWMTENLSGYGGTEIDGRWYYTWEEAMAAAEQLGDGWRLPTREEFVQLDGLGSVWKEDGPHGLPGRLFGGGLFLDAAGLRDSSTGTMYEVDEDGWFWASFTTTANPLGAGQLWFSSGNVDPLCWNYRNFGVSARCVRDVE